VTLMMPYGRTGPRRATSMTYQRFRDLHQGPGLLLLPNAWDAVSARLIESLGAKAIATTSAGLAWSNGYPDGNALPEDQLITAIREIARVIRVPLTVDIEAGYADGPDVVAAVIARILDVGVVGINIEDGAGSVELLCKKIAAIRDRAAHSHCDLFINARTDVYLWGIASGEAAIEEVVRRVSRYRAAGCDGLFVPGLKEVDAMAMISRAIAPMPLNIMAVPHLPSMDTLKESGVRRLSAGSSIAQAVLGRASQLVSDFLAGTMSEMFEVSADYAAVNRLFARNTDRP
jgi:2-methylisocitrate lyase-like PEP mutase family enzyme